MKQKKVSKMVVAGGLFLLMAGNYVGAQDLPQIRGFVSQGVFSTRNYNYLDTDTRGSLSANMRELGFNIQKPIGDRFSAGMQILSRSVGTYGQNKVILDWAYGSARITDYLNVSVGRNKTELGLYTSVQDFDFLTPFALMPNVIYDKGLRTMNASLDGIKFSGDIFLSGGGNLSYSAMIGTTDVGPETDLADYVGTLGITYDEIEVDFTTILGFRYTPPAGNITASVTWSRVNSSEMRGVTRAGIPREFFVMDAQDMANRFYFGLEYDHPKFMIMGEYLHEIFETEQLITMPQGTFSNTENRSRGGGYLGSLIRPLDWFNFGGYYQMWFRNYSQDDRPEGVDLNDYTNTHHDLALTTVFRIGSDVVIKLEGHHVNGIGQLSPAQNIGNDFKEKSWQYFVAKATFNF